MFCALPLRVLSGVSLETAANFLLFLNVAIKLGKSLSAVKTEFSLFYIGQVKLLLNMREKSSKNKQSNDGKV